MDVQYKLKFVKQIKSSGLLGRSVVSEFSNQPEWNVVGLCYSRCRDGLVKLDLTDYFEVDKFIEEFKPNVIIHCAAEKRVENVESMPEKSANLNIGAKV